MVAITLLAALVMIGIMTSTSPHHPHMTFCHAAFRYTGFRPDDDVTGIKLNGHARYEKCGSDVVQEARAVSLRRQDTTTSTLREEVGAAEIEMGYSDDGREGDTCLPALRLTSALPHQAGTAWMETKQGVVDQWESRFIFRITNSSRGCERRWENSVTATTTSPTIHYDTCAMRRQVHFGQSIGGDGFAFVIQNSPAHIDTLGSTGRHLGIGGVRNVLAVEFDTYVNNEDGDTFRSHIRIRGARGTSTTSTSTITVPMQRMSHDHHHLFTDGRNHTVRITLWPQVKDEHYDVISITQVSQQYITGQVRTLCIYIDDVQKPVLCLPINIGALLDVPGGIAYVGFSAATGAAWQNHDILSWEFCGTAGCTTG